MVTRLSDVRRAVRDERDPARAAFVKGYFRTGKGEYGEGDRFLGLSVPAVRAIARTARDLPLKDIETLLHSAWHEERLLALLILVGRSKKAPEKEKQEICRFFLRNRRHVNNWDLVDSSAPQLVGPWIATAAKRDVESLSRSRSVWDRRISVLAHQYAIRAGDVDAFLAFAPRFLDDAHDLIHKAVGWMLREVGERDPAKLRRFLDDHAPRMPRTMLRYAIEKFPAAERKRYLERKRSA